jgi:hypothetical protein
MMWCVFLKSEKLEVDVLKSDVLELDVLAQCFFRRSLENYFFAIKLY